jgi:hypothetical protein
VVPEPKTLLLNANKAAKDIIATPRVQVVP